MMLFGVGIGQLSASDFPTVTGTPPNVSFPATQVPAAIDLRNYFAVTGISGTVVQFTTPGVGAFNVEMNAAAAPNTVANFLSYVNAGSYADSIIHRSVPGFVIQGGGFLNNPSLSAIPANAPIALETADTLLNARGAIAMARSLNSNSATTQWFINTIDNSVNLSPASAGGYAVFGRVTGTGMTVVDAIAARPILNGNVFVNSCSTTSSVVNVNVSTLPPTFGAGWVFLGSTVSNVAGNIVTLNANANQALSGGFAPTSKFFSPFDQLPVLQPLPPGGTVFLSNLITNHTIKVVPIFPAAPNAPSVVTFSASSSNPVITATLSGSSLSLAATANVNATATVTVTATDTNGNFAQSAFQVTATVPTALQSWRQTWFGSTANTGNAVNDADPYHRGIPNLATFALLGPAQNPATASIAQLPQVQMSGGNFFYQFNTPGGASGVTYAAEWRPDLATGNWQSVADSGSGTLHIFSIPTGPNPQIFLRLKVTEQ